MPRAKQRTPELAERVLDAALRLLADEGPAGLTARGLAAEAGTSPAAVYELFGDKGGVVRALFFSGWARLAAALQEVPVTGDPIADLQGIAARYRAQLLAHPALGAVMLARPFAAFDPGPEEAAAGAAVRDLILGAVRRAAAAHALAGDPDDVAHAYVALIHGLAAAEAADRLGRTPVAVERRWTTAVAALLRGFAP